MMGSNKESVLYGLDQKNGRFYSYKLTLYTKTAGSQQKPNKYARYTSLHALYHTPFDTRSSTTTLLQNFHLCMPADDYTQQLIASARSTEGGAADTCGTGEKRATYTKLSPQVITMTNTTHLNEVGL